MNNTPGIERMTTGSAVGPWKYLAERVLDGGRITRDEGLAILRCDDAELLDLLTAEKILDGACLGPHRSY